MARCHQKKLSGDYLPEEAAHPQKAQQLHAAGTTSQPPCVTEVLHAAGKGSKAFTSLQASPALLELLVFDLKRSATYPFSKGPAHGLLAESL